MKGAGAIRQKLKQAAFRHLKRRLNRELATAPCNCVWNGRLELPDGNHIFVCRKTMPEGVENPGVCDDRHEGVEKAEGCDWFELNGDKDEAKEEFREFLSTANLAEVAADYPDLAALLWVLQEEAPGREIEIEANDDWEEDTEEGTPELVDVEFVGEAEQIVTIRVATGEDAEFIRNMFEEFKLTVGILDAVNGAFAMLKKDYEEVKADHEYVSRQLNPTPEPPLEPEPEPETRMVIPDAEPPVSWWERFFGRSS